MNFMWMKKPNRNNLVPKSQQRFDGTNDLPGDVNSHG